MGIDLGTDWAWRRRAQMVVVALCVMLVAAPAEAGRRRCRGDADCDGLSNKEERRLGTNRRSADTDRDGLSDGFEVSVLGSDPTRSDSDGDGRDDGSEVRGGTDPRDADSDHDGKPDGQDCDPWNDLAAKVQGNIEVITCPTDDASGSITVLGNIIALTPQTGYGRAGSCAGLDRGAQVEVRVTMDADAELFAVSIEVKDSENDGCPDPG